MSDTEMIKATKELCENLYMNTLVDNLTKENDKLKKENAEQNEALEGNADMMSGMSSDVMILQERIEKLKEENEKLKKDILELLEERENVRACCDHFGHYEEGATVE